jgi:phosphatidylserine decarboxylase
MHSSNLVGSKINNKLPFAREGLPFIFIGTFVTLLFLYLGFLVITVLTGAISLFTVFFFRDPARENHVPEKSVLTPADGKILEIQYLKDDNNPLGEPAVKVSVFMSLFSVHVNRIPIGGKILSILYNPGKFFAANLNKASDQNENNRIILQTGDGRRIVFVQIAGLIARRIVCWIKEGDHVRTGQRFGLIRFGSRLDLYLPDDTRIIVQPFHKVRAGETILGYLS